MAHHQAVNVVEREVMKEVVTEVIKVVEKEVVKEVLDQLNRACNHCFQAERRRAISTGWGRAGGPG